MLRFIKQRKLFDTLQRQAIDATKRYYQCTTESGVYGYRPRKPEKFERKSKWPKKNSENPINSLRIALWTIPFVKPLSRCYWFTFLIMKMERSDHAQQQTPYKRYWNFCNHNLADKWQKSFKVLWLIVVCYFRWFTMCLLSWNALPQQLR